MAEGNHDDGIRVWWIDRCDEMRCGVRQMWCIECDDANDDAER